ncbi:hypothetical protein TDB9533_02364 [Thalassocella blandensis]|nr:hypothetical protein TDB9533_02364 [Thalassocella blandensis]
MIKKVLSAVIISSLSLSALASDNPMEGKVTAGVKLGLFMADSGDAGSDSVSVDVDDGSGFGIQLGYKVNDNIAVEFEYLSTSLDVEFSTDTLSASDSLDVDTMAIYGVYRTSGDFYFLGKAGLLSEDVSGPGESGSDTGLSFGIGGGATINEMLSVEAEYTILEDDISFFGVTGRYHF